MTNIRLTDSVLEAEYTPEDSGISAHVTYDISTGKGRAEHIPEYGQMYARQAINGLMRTAEELEKKGPGQMRTERIVMWF